MSNNQIFVSGNTLTFQGKTYRCAVGKNGFARDKKEGDGATPLGTFPLRECWYRVDRLSAPVTKLPMCIIQENDGWCDDLKSGDYNRHIKLPLTAPSPLSGEGWGGGAFKAANKKLLGFAKKLRSDMTEVEKLLWYHLRTHRFYGHGFRRQYMIGGRYIVDFVCLEKKLIIELDGGQHSESKTDELRDNFLCREGFKVLRFWNNEVLQNMEAVLGAILSSLATPSLTFPPQGGGYKKNDRGCGYERLWRTDHVYDLIIPLGYNDNPIVAGRGSAIFMHIAHDDYRGTEGCIALAKQDLLEVLAGCSASTTITISS